jgi:hypothetical protein
MDGFLGDRPEAEGLKTVLIHLVMLHAHLLVLKFQKLQALMDSVSYFGRPLEK